MLEKTLEEEDSFHKRWLMKINEVTRIDTVIEFLDTYMKPLPFIVQACLSTVFISVVPILLIWFISKLLLTAGDKVNEGFTNIMLSFALGGLLGDVFFHTLPHLNEGHSHSHDHSHHAHNTTDGHKHDEGHGHKHSVEDMMINLVVIGGIMTFFLIE
jgi:hypothetical protein